MNSLQYLKKFLKTIPEFSASVGCSKAGLLWSYGMCYIFLGANSEEFRALQLYRRTAAERRKYFLMRECVRVSDRLNAGADEAELAVYDNKQLFNKTFRDFVKRDWLFIPDSTDDDIRAFLARNDMFMCKICNSTQGKGISKHVTAETDIEAFLAEHRGQPYLLEGFIRQHPDMARPNPGTVNTVRVQTARRGDRVILLGSCMRVGGAEAQVDNFHQGGIAYPIDVETGIISGRGQTLRGDNIYIRHPSTGTIMPGFKIPYWDELVETLKKAAVLTPHVGYVGWDIAITEDGPEFVEGNINYPDPIVVQLDDMPYRQRLHDFLGGR